MKNTIIILSLIRTRIIIGITITSALKRNGAPRPVPLLFYVVSRYTAPMEKTVKSSTGMETEAVHALRGFIQKHNKETGALVIGLSGELGTGKTVFVKAAARELGITEMVTSPTFVIEKIYKLSTDRYSFLVHIDAYRIGSCEEMAHVGWNALQKDPKNIIFVEWADRISACMPKETVWVNITHVTEFSRKLYYGNTSVKK